MASDMRTLFTHPTFLFSLWALHSPKAAFKRSLHWGWMLWESIFTCNHSETPLREGKSHCVSCGRGIVLRWAVPRCDGCGHQREGRYFLRQIVPRERHCPRCGATGFSLNCLENPAWYQLDKALAFLQPERDFLASRTWAQRTRAWLEEEQPHRVASRLVPSPV